MDLIYWTAYMIHSHGEHACIIREEKVLLLKRSAYKNTYPNEWDLPGGTSLDQETPEQTISREIEEECGISPDDIVSINLLGAREMRDEHTKWQGTLTFYCVSVDNPSITLSDEHTAYAWVALDQVHTYLPQRVIVGVCLSLYNEYKNRP